MAYKSFEDRCACEDSDIEQMRQLNPFLVAGQRFWVSHLTDAKNKLEHIWTDRIDHCPACGDGMPLTCRLEHKLQQLTAEEHRCCLNRRGVLLRS